MANPNRSRIRLVLATHGDLACALLTAAESIAGPQTDVVCVMLAPGQALDGFKAQVQAAISASNATLILVDMAGGTPWNVALSLARHCPSLRIVSGANLPMLLEVMLSRENMDIDQLARLARDTGARSAQIAASAP